MGFPWWPSSENSMFPVHGAQVQTLIRELRSHMTHGEAKESFLIIFFNLKKKNEAEAMYQAWRQTLHLHHITHPLSWPCETASERYPG